MLPITSEAPATTLALNRAGRPDLRSQPRRFLFLKRKKVLPVSEKLVVTAGQMVCLAGKGGC
jgi:hypothetical protein